MKKAKTVSSMNPGVESGEKTSRVVIQYWFCVWELHF